MIDKIIDGKNRINKHIILKWIGAYGYCAVECINIATLLKQLY